MPSRSVQFIHLTPKLKHFPRTSKSNLYSQHIRKKENPLPRHLWSAPHPGSKKISRRKREREREPLFVRLEIHPRRFVLIVAQGDRKLELIHRHCNNYTFIFCCQVRNKQPCIMISGMELRWGWATLLLRLFASCLSLPITSYEELKCVHLSPDVDSWNSRFEASFREVKLEFTIVNRHPWYCWIYPNRFIENLHLNIFEWH